MKRLVSESAPASLKGAPQQRALEACPHCGAPVSVKKLARHVALRCPAKRLVGANKSQGVHRSGGGPPAMPHSGETKGGKPARAPRSVGSSLPRKAIADWSLVTRCLNCQEWVLRKEFAAHMSNCLGPAKLAPPQKHKKRSKKRKKDKNRKNRVERKPKGGDVYDLPAGFRLRRW